MRGTNRNRKLLAFAAAAVLGGSLWARPASANTLYSTDFATYTDNSNSTSGSFSTGPIGGQDSWVTIGNGGGSTANVTATPSLVIDRTSTSDQVLSGPVTSFSNASPFEIDSTVTVSSATAGTSTNGPFFGVDIFGGLSGGSNIASLGIDAATGNIVESVGGVIYNLSTGTPPLAPTGTPATLEIEATFSGGNVYLNYLVDGTSYDMEEFDGVSTFYSAELAGLTGYESGTDGTGSGTFTNYLVTESAVPEPTGLGIACVGAVLIGLRRNRRAVAGI